MKIKKNVNFCWSGSPRLDPRLLDLPKIVAVEENGDLRLTARIIAYPSPVIRWIFKNEINSTLVLIGSLYVANLHIPDFKQSEFGEYTLHAFNDQGNLFEQINVVPRGERLYGVSYFVTYSTEFIFVIKRCSQ